MTHEQYVAASNKARADRLEREANCNHEWRRLTSFQSYDIRLHRAELKVLMVCDKCGADETRHLY